MTKKNSKMNSKKRLYQWVLRLVKNIGTFPRNSTADVLGKQLLRSSTSILANYIEANSASSKKDFTNYFTHSLKSANESKVWLALLRDTNIGDGKEMEWAIKELVEISNIIASSIITLKRKK